MIQTGLISSLMKSEKMKTGENRARDDEEKEGGWRN